MAFSLNRRLAFGAGGRINIVHMIGATHASPGCDIVIFDVYIGTAYCVMNRFVMMSRLLTNQDILHNTSGFINNSFLCRLHDI